MTVCRVCLGKHGIDYRTKNLNESLTFDLNAHVTESKLYYLCTIAICFVVGFYTAIIIENIGIFIEYRKLYVNIYIIQSLYYNNLNLSIELYIYFY